MALLLALLAAGCQSGGGGGPVRNFERGDQLAFYDFSEPNTFEEWMRGTLTGGVVMRIEDGKYRIRLTEGDSELWWVQWGEIYGDVVIDVDVEQISERNENAYGIMCRVRGEVMSAAQRAEIDPQVAFLATQVASTIAEETPALEATSEATAEVVVEGTAEAESTPDAEATLEVSEDETPVAESTEIVTIGEVTPEATVDGGDLLSAEETPIPEGDGYLFLIQGAGSYGIFKARGRALIPLVDWTTSDIIHLGPDTNHLRAVCLGDYLAFYINGEFIADAVDDEYQQGQVGMVASASNILGVRVEFDNLTIAQARAR
jgi:hypothetical protein